MQPSNRPDGSAISALQSRKVDPIPFRDTMPSLNSSFGSPTNAEHLSNKKSTFVTLAQPANISPGAKPAPCGNLKTYSPGWLTRTTSRNAPFPTETRDVQFTKAYRMSLPALSQQGISINFRERSTVSKRRMSQSGVTVHKRRSAVNAAAPIKRWQRSSPLRSR